MNRRALVFIESKEASKLMLTTYREQLNKLENPITPPLANSLMTPDQLYICALKNDSGLAASICIDDNGAKGKRSHSTEKYVEIPGEGEIEEGGVGEEEEMFEEIMTFRDLLITLFSEYGVITATGDMNQFTRSTLSTVLTSHASSWRMCISTSALAEGVNPDNGQQHTKERLP